MVEGIFSQEEIDFLKEFYVKYGGLYCAEKLNRSVGSVVSKTSKLKLIFCGIEYKYHKENFEPIVKNCITYSDVMRSLGLPVSTGNYRTIKKYILLYNISISHFDPNKISTERIKNFNRESKKSLSEILVQNSTYGTNNLKHRLYKEGIKKRFCEVCGQGEEWYGKKLSLILDHINGISNDHRFENLQIVCPNCNATLDTHCRGSEKLRRKLQKELDKENLQIEKQNKKEQNIKKLLSKEEIAIKISLTKRTVERPPYEQLKTEINDLGYSATGRKYGVSDNAIRKWVKVYEKYFNERPGSELN